MTDLLPGDHVFDISYTGYQTLRAKINVSSTGVVTCVTVNGSSCPSSGTPRISISGSVVTVYLAVIDICTFITNRGGWSHLDWTQDILKAYNTWMGAADIPIGYSPVTWDSVLGLYYYFMGDKSDGNLKTGCVFT